jgi:hypothetical protein
MTEVDANAADIHTVAQHIGANPPDGQVHLVVDDADGSVQATWTSGGQHVAVGPSITRPLPPGAQAPKP